MVDLFNGMLVRRTEGNVDRRFVGGEPNGITFWRNKLWFCDRSAGAIRSLSLTDETETGNATFASKSLNKPNDLAFDRLGNLVFTCPGDSRTEPTGTVWCLRPTGELTLVADSMFFPNGLAFSPDGGELAVAETYRQRIWRGGWVPSDASWAGAKPWAQMHGAIGPDGMAFDNAGRLYVAHFGQGAILVYSNAGEELARLNVPGTRPTNLAFDPNGVLGLVVTEVDTGALWAWPDAPAGCTPNYGACET
jgi:gluconolactonase